MCNVRYDPIHNAVKKTGQFRNMLTIAILIGIDCIFLLRNAKNGSQRVLEFSIVMRSFISRLVILTTSIDSVFKQSKLLKLGKLMQRYLQQRNLKIRFHSIKTNGNLIRLQTATLLIVTCGVNSVTLYHIWNRMTLILGNRMAIHVCTGLYIHGNLIFYQYFARFLIHEHRQLSSNLKKRTLKSSVYCAYKLTEIKAAITDTFGVQFLLVLFQQLFITSFLSYQTLISFVLFGIKLEGVAISYLLLNILVLFGTSYSFECSESEVCTA